MATFSNPSLNTDNSGTDLHNGAIYFPEANGDKIKAVSINLVVKHIDDNERNLNVNNFFAIQANFNNSTWAHGGLQSHQVNWGGLVWAGPSNGYDRQQSVSAAEIDILKIQNESDVIRNQPFEYVVGKEYRLTINRSGMEKFPSGQKVRVIGGGVEITTKSERNMYVWEFLVDPVDGKGPSVRSVLYNSADAISSFCVWNELGHPNNQLTHWSLPTYTKLDDTVVTVQSYDRREV